MAQEGERSSPLPIQHADASGLRKVLHEIAEGRVGRVQVGVGCGHDRLTRSVNTESMTPAAEQALTVQTALPARCLTPPSSSRDRTVNHFECRTTNKECIPTDRSLSPLARYAHT